MRGIVKEVKPQKLILDDGTEVPYGLLVWSTGVGPSSFVRSLDFPKDPGGRSVIPTSQQKLVLFFSYIPQKLIFEQFLILDHSVSIGLESMNGCVYLLQKMCLQLVIVAVILRAQGNQHFLLLHRSLSSINMNVPFILLFCRLRI